MDLCCNLRRFYAFCQTVGLIHFRYNKSEEKIERSLPQTFANTLEISAITILSALSLLIFAATSFVDVFADKGVGIDDDGGQNSLLESLGIFVHLFATFLYGWNYLMRRQVLTTTVSELLKIYKCLRRETSSHLFIGSRPAELFALKLCIVFLQVTVSLISHIFIVVPFVDIIILVVFAMRVCMPVAYMFLQMVLICFYNKMNAYLETFGEAANSGQLHGFLRKFAQISRRIHRVKMKTDAYFAPLFAVTYLGLVFDIHKIYCILTVILYSKYARKDQDLWSYIQGSHNLTSVAYTLDVYLINLLSDILVGCEEEFQRRMFLISLKTPEARSYVDLMPLQGHICGVRTYAFYSIRISRDSGLKIIFAVVVCNVLTCLQVYAAQEIYLK